MSPWSAAQPGAPAAQIDTPALLLDLDAFDRNLARMQAALAGSGTRLRPHAKSHKCPEIARRQIAAGAVGICCQKLAEAAVFVNAGIEDVLITNQVVGPAKLQRLAELATRARIGVLVDHARQAQDLSAAAHARGARVDVYVEVDVGAGRCGVRADQAGALAAQIVALPALRFAGLHCYHGSAQHLRRPEERQAAIAAAAAHARAARDAVEAAGIPVGIITGAGTGSFVHERDSGVYNELQPGSYIFMDRDYADNTAGPDDIRFEHALFVKTTVQSRPVPGRAVVDAGLKASSVDSGMPAPWQQPDVGYLKASDEHGVLGGDDGALPAMGESLLLVPGHCDPTVNLYDELVCVRGLASGAGTVEAVWKIEARGALL
ncbi:MAG TPA: DSD1 family PLP-dependent enzyme [Noviherbaspirillum sp.]|nr:DSD1 family PLP-dependent enzyme [Noviherbaspirillum sp.]